MTKEPTVTGDKPMNRHYLFHKYYFDKPDEPIDQKVMKEKTEKMIAPYEDVAPPDVSDIKGLKQFTMEVRYPGLLVGIGYPHDFGELLGKEAAKEAIKLGFSFDYVTGLPYIPGSSVKGVLRSAFKRKADAVKGMPTKLEEEIFEGADAKNPDTFFDAYPVRGQDKLLSLEAITPHSEGPRDPLAGLREPNSIKLLKVPPGVQFQFRFQLSDSTALKNADGEVEVITADKKCRLFIEIIEELGMGAKTNVGFGVMKHIPNS